MQGGRGEGSRMYSLRSTAHRRGGSQGRLREGRGRRRRRLRRRQRSAQRPRPGPGRAAGRATAEGRAAGPRCRPPPCAPGTRRQAWSGCRCLWFPRSCLPSTAAPSPRPPCPSYHYSPHPHPLRPTHHCSPRPHPPHPTHHYTRRSAQTPQSVCSETETSSLTVQQQALSEGMDCAQITGRRMSRE